LALIASGQHDHLAFLVDDYFGTFLVSQQVHVRGLELAKARYIDPQLIEFLIAGRIKHFFVQ
jgi:hypothetical protein